MKIYQERIKELRKERNFNQEQLAKVTEVTQSNYSKYERGERDLSPEQIIKLCEFYNVSPEYVLGFTDEKKPLK